MEFGVRKALPQALVSISLIKSFKNSNVINKSTEKIKIVKIYSHEIKK